MKLVISARGFVPDQIPSLAAIVKEVGVRELEIPVPAGWQEGECRDLRQRLEREGLRPAVCAVGLSGSPPATSVIGSTLDRALCQSQGLGTSLINLYCSLEANQDPVPARANLAEALRLRVETAQRRGQVFTLENELAAAPNIAGTVPAWLDLAERVASPAFRLTLDLANFIGSDDTRFAARQTAAWPLIGHVHFKDLVPHSPELAARFPSGQVFRVANRKLLAVPLGSGIVDHDPVIRALAGHAYPGRLTLEAFGDAKSLRQSVEFLQRRWPIGNQT